MRIHIRIRIHRPGRHLLGSGDSVLKVSGEKCRTVFVVAKTLLDPSHIFANSSGGMLEGEPSGAANSAAGAAGTAQDGEKT
jgi:hypothetical protein